MGAIPTTPDVPQPTIYALERDYARFGLTKQQANEIIHSRFNNRNGAEPLFVVLHVQEGTTKSSLAYWSAADVDASSTVMIQKDGSILRIVPEEHGPWTNGDVCEPTHEAAEILAKGGNANCWSLTIEAEGYYQETKPKPQMDAILWQVEDWIMRYPAILDSTYGILRHGWINSCTRANCPGVYFDPIVARVNRWLETAGTDVGPAEEDDALANLPKSTYVLDPNLIWDDASSGPVGALWRQYGEATGSWGAPVGGELWNDKHDGYTLYQFDNGLVIAKDKNGTVGIVTKVK
ncbi:MAG TPA: N-acetylmuramoyl-L-alanine amidase [Tepidisphaeraceae bacterium]|jgi:N-acetyl-anhydromuramyl-L-alanine amidase AmpD